jgi:site-specific recombinase XerD
VFVGAWRNGGDDTVASAITYTPATRESKRVILIQFKFDRQIIDEVKKLPGRKWDAGLKSWYVPDTKENRARFGLPVKIGLPSKRELPKVCEVNKTALNALREKLILKGYSKNTQRTYYYEFAQLLYLLGAHDVNDMDEEKIRSYFLYCAEKLKMTESQINSRYNAVKFYFEQVLGREKFFIDLPRPKAPSQLPKYISTRDIKKLFATVANTKHALMLKLCYGMGLRVSEIVNIKVKDIDSGNMQVLIERGKGKKDRYANLPESILDDLRAYCKEYRPQKYLFEGQGGGKYSIRSVQNVFTTAMRKANINKDVGIHGLRHSFATHLLENGTDISYIQQLLGHHDIKTTLIYAKVAQKNLKKIKSPLDGL